MPDTTYILEKLETLSSLDFTEQFTVQIFDRRHCPEENTKNYLCLVFIQHNKESLDTILVEDLNTDVNDLLPKLNLAFQRFYHKNKGFKIELNSDIFKHLIADAEACDDQVVKVIDPDIDDDSTAILYYGKAKPTFRISIKETAILNFHFKSVDLFLIKEDSTESRIAIAGADIYVTDQEIESQIIALINVYPDRLDLMSLDVNFSN